MLRIGIDLGGTKIEGVVLDAAGFQRARRRVPTPRGSYAGIVRAVADLVHGLEAEAGGPATVGLGIPGALSPATGLVKNANTTELIGHPLDGDLGEALGRPVRIENDANCLALSEASDGAGQGCGVVFAVILGTGCGGGLAIGGRAIAGRHRIAGEWGHNPLPWLSAAEFGEQQRCYCGQLGCLETWISGTGLALDYARHGGRRDTAERIMARCAEEPAADEAYRRYAGRLARALAAVVNILDPDVIVLGGGMSKVETLYRDVPALMPAYVMSDVFETPIRPALHGDASGVRGAAWLGGMKPQEG